MRILFRLLIIACLAVLLAIGGTLWWSQQPLSLPKAGVDFRITPGSSLRLAVDQLADAGVGINRPLFLLWARAHGHATAIKAGSYVALPGDTPTTLLDKLINGRVTQGDITLVEGWTFRQFRSRLDAHADLIHDTRGLSEAEIIGRLGLNLASLEGWLFPDTYLFDKQSSDLELIARAVRAMQRHLDQHWQQRPAGLPYRTPSELLTMASIIEKETGRAEDRPHVAAVFINRLQRGMRLQTDPTVIYGLGPAFDGNLRKVDLQTDTPYNTYTRSGLPPTPIAMPGAASLQAAISPAVSDALYFVARGDGGSHFSQTLEEHNRAVNKFQRRGQ